MDDRQLSTRPITDAPPAPDRFAALGLDRNPFTGAGPLVTLPGQEQALAGIREWISGVTADATRSDRLAVLTGVAGMGKSRLLRALVADAPTPARVPVIDPGKGGLTDAQLLRAIIDAFGGTATGRTGMELRRDIRLALADLPADAAPGLLIDDADFTGARLELIRNVLRDGAETGLWIVLAGQPDLADRLARRRSFRAILGPSVQLEAMDPESGAALLGQRVEAATGRHRRHLLLTPDATTEIVAWAEGNPGQMLHVAEVALSLAMRQGQDTVDRPSVRLAIQQLESPARQRPETERAPGDAVQAEIPLFAGPGPTGTTRGAGQRSLWGGGADDDAAPD